MQILYDRTHCSSTVTWRMCEWGQVWIGTTANFHHWCRTTHWCNDTIFPYSLFIATEATQVLRGRTHGRTQFWSLIRNDLNVKVLRKYDPDFVNESLLGISSTVKLCRAYTATIEILNEGNLNWEVRECMRYNRWSNGHELGKLMRHLLFQPGKQP